MLLPTAPDPRPRVQAASERAGHTQQALRDQLLSPDPCHPGKSTPTLCTAPRAFSPACGFPTRLVSSSESRLILKHNKPEGSFGVLPPEAQGSPLRSSSTSGEGAPARSVPAGGNTIGYRPTFRVMGKRNPVWKSQRVWGGPGNPVPGVLLLLPEELVPRGKSTCLTLLLTFLPDSAHL